MNIYMHKLFGKMKINLLPDGRWLGYLFPPKDIISSIQHENAPLFSVSYFCMSGYQIKHSAAWWGTILFYCDAFLLSLQKNSTTLGFLSLVILVCVSSSSFRCCNFGVKLHRKQKIIFSGSNMIMLNRFIACNIWSIFWILPTNRQLWWESTMN